MDPQTGRNPFYDSAIIDSDSDTKDPAAEPTGHLIPRSPFPRSRSFSDGGPAKLSPSPHIVPTTRRTKDDSSLKGSTTSNPNNTINTSIPSTPVRDVFSRRGLSLQAAAAAAAPLASPAQLSVSAASSPYLASRVAAAPLSPKLDVSQQGFASPTNILPRRSRGLDFSRAATNLHHSTLADSPDSSPTMGGRLGMHIPGQRRSGDFSGMEQSSTSLWSVMGSQGSMGLSGSLGSVPGIPGIGPDDSSESSEDDYMDEDMIDESYLTTPQAKPASGPSAQPSPWSLSGSPTVSGLANFQQRQRPKKQPRRRLPGSLGILGLGGVSSGGISRSPPNGMAVDVAHPRRESISWQANQMHLSGSEGEDGSRAVDSMDGLRSAPGRDGQRSVIRKVVTRRGNLLPKTKGFARIRAALAEECTPVEAEICREAEVVRQVYENDAPVGPIPMAPLSATTTTTSSPALPPQDTPDDVDDMVADAGLGISNPFRQPPFAKNKMMLWDASDSSSAGGTGTYTTPPPPTFRARGSSSLSEDVNMDSPQPTTGFAVPTGGSDSQRSDVPSHMQMHGAPHPPTAAEITRRINNKRRRDDDLDPVAMKRRAVSPSISVHNSPIMQSPMQRDAAPWGTSRPASINGDASNNNKAGSSGVSEAGSLSGGTPSGGRVGTAGRRVGFQGMVDTNDGMMRMSIE